MNRRFNLIAFLVISFFVSSCDKEMIELPETPINPEVPGTNPDPEPDPEPEKIIFGVNPTIAGMEVVTRGIITQFTDNDKIGLFLTDGELGLDYNGSSESANIPAQYYSSRGAWKVERDVEITTDGVAYAYYPYSATATNGTAIPVEVASQTDYLYATKSTVDKARPTAEIGMKHALSLVSIRVRKNDYQHAGKLQKVEILDVYQEGIMDIGTGVVTVMSPGTYVTESTLTLDDAVLEKTKMIMIPQRIVESSGNVRFRLTIDGRIYNWDVPKSHHWEAGKEYTYTMNLTKTPDEITDLELDVDYWKDYGKDDNMTIEDHTQHGSPSFRIFDVEMSSTSYGRTVVRGESYIFGAVINSRENGWKGKVKYTLWQGNKLIEQFPAYNVKVGIFSTIYIPCFVTAPAGEYRLKILMQTEGTSNWIIPSDRYSEERDWIFRVKESNNTPSIQSMNLEGYNVSLSAIRKVKLNQSFNLEYKLTNRSDLPLKGEIKAVWHRTFTGEFNLIGEDDGIIWSDEIGRETIDLPNEIKEYKGIMPCVISINRVNVNRWVPTISFYYRAEGSSNWEFMRSDSDSELQHWKGIDMSDKYVGPYQQHSETLWGVIDGQNFQYIILED